MTMSSLGNSTYTLQVEAQHFAQDSTSPNAILFRRILHHLTFARPL